MEGRMDRQTTSQSRWGSGGQRIERQEYKLQEAQGKVSKKKVPCMCGAGKQQSSSVYLGQSLHGKRQAAGPREEVARRPGQFLMAAHNCAGNLIWDLGPSGPQAFLL